MTKKQLQKYGFEQIGNTPPCYGLELNSQNSDTYITYEHSEGYLFHFGDKCQTINITTKEDIEALRRIFT